ncbi:hypothetical protein C8R47DRAFT_1303399 [Mycena vitilis]|nr:hypothetical protein C8R47DRAFT_1303399 [Mycena vitilis]
MPAPAHTYDLRARGTASSSRLTAPRRRPSRGIAPSASLASSPLRTRFGRAGSAASETKIPLARRRTSAESARQGLRIDIDTLGGAGCVAAVAAVWASMDTTVLKVGSTVSRTLAGRLHPLRTPIDMRRWLPPGGSNERTAGSTSGSGTRAGGGDMEDRGCRCDTVTANGVIVHRLGLLEGQDVGLRGPDERRGGVVGVGVVFTDTYHLCPVSEMGRPRHPPAPISCRSMPKSFSRRTVGGRRAGQAADASAKQLHGILRLLLGNLTTMDFSSAVQLSASGVILLASSFRPFAVLYFG